METLVTDAKTLKAIAKTGKIAWPVTTNWNPKTKPFKYIDSDLSELEYNGQKFKVKYLAGCFYPFLYKIS